MVTASGYNVHHFVYEHLTSAWIHREVFEHRPKVLVGASDMSANAFQGPLLRLLGLRIEPVLLPLHSRVRLRDCTMLASLTFRLYPTEALREVRERICRNVVLSGVDAPNSGVVYLGRGDQERNRRPLVNEQEVIGVLRERWPDLTVIRSALQPVEQTVAAIRGARVIVGPTAGALVHHVWASNLEHVVELVPDEYPGVSETEEVGEFLSFTHHNVSTRTVRGNPQDRWVDAGQEANIPALRATLASLS
jgi:capsular polysaccharide biosynthesis protein